MPRTCDDYWHQMCWFVLHGLKHGGYVKEHQKMHTILSGCKKQIFKDAGIVIRHSSTPTAEQIRKTILDLDDWVKNPESAPTYREGKNPMDKHGLQMVRCAVHLCMAANARRSEVFGLKMKDVDPKNWRVVMAVTKGRIGSEDTFTIGRLHQDALMVWYEQRISDGAKGDDPLFTGAQSTFGDKVNGMLKQTGMIGQWAGMHKLRKFMTSLAINEDATPQEIRAWGTWGSDQAMTNYCSQIVNDNLSAKCAQKAHHGLEKIMGTVDTFETRLQSITETMKLETALQVEASALSGTVASPPALFKTRYVDGEMISERVDSHTELNNLVGSGGFEPPNPPVIEQLRNELKSTAFQALESAQAGDMRDALSLIKVLSEWGDN